MPLLQLEIINLYYYEQNVCNGNCFNLESKGPCSIYVNMERKKTYMILQLFEESAMSTASETLLLTDIVLILETKQYCIHSLKYE